MDEIIQAEIGFITFIGEATIQDSNIAKIQKMIYLGAIQGHTGGITIMPELMRYVSIPYDWKEFVFHRGSAFDYWSIIKTGLVAGGKESKEGRQIVFFTPLDPSGSDKNQEEPSEDYTKPREVPYHSS